MVCEAGLAVIEKFVPVPLRLTVWVLPATPLPLSVMVSVPDKAPVDCGVKVMPIGQLEFCASELPQPLLLIEKLPLIEIGLMASAAVPVFERVTVCAGLVVPCSWFPKERLGGETPALGTPTPVPVRLTVWVPLPALSVTVRVALSAPTMLGVKVTLTEQLLPGLTGLTQVLSAAVKSALFVPLTLVPVMLSAAVPVLVTVRGRVLALPRFWLPKASEEGTLASSAAYKRTETVASLVLATAKSSRPSPLKSPTATLPGWPPVAGEDAALKFPVPSPSRMLTVLP